MCSHLASLSLASRPLGGLARNLPGAQQSRADVSEATGPSRGLKKRAVMVRKKARMVKKKAD